VKQNLEEFGHEDLELFKRNFSITILIGFADDLLELRLFDSIGLVENGHNFINADFAAAVLKSILKI
jgi:hypothetical protein